MLISESGLARRLKFAYRHTGGYTVYNDGDNMMVYTEMWLVRAQRQLFPRKALGVIVEHIGDLPDAGVAIYTAKDTPPQDVFSDVAREDAGGWMCGDRGAQELLRLPQDLHAGREAGDPGRRRVLGLPRGHPGGHQLGRRKHAGCGCRGRRPAAVGGAGRDRGNHGTAQGGTGDGPGVGAGGLERAGGH